MSEWQLKDTAPRDGTWFLTYTADDRDDYSYPGFDFAKWDDEIEAFVKSGCGWCYVTHWQPLPEPPKIDA